MHSKTVQVNFTCTLEIIFSLSDYISQIILVESFRQTVSWYVMVFCWTMDAIVSSTSFYLLTVVLCSCKINWLCNEGMQFKPKFIQTPDIICYYFFY